MGELFLEWCDCWMWLNNFKSQNNTTGIKKRERNIDYEREEEAAIEKEDEIETEKDRNGDKEEIIERELRETKKRHGKKQNH